MGYSCFRDATKLHEDMLQDSRWNHKWNQQQGLQRARVEPSRLATEDGMYIHLSMDIEFSRELQSPHVKRILSVATVDEFMQCVSSRSQMVCLWACAKGPRVLEKRGHQFRGTCGACSLVLSLGPWHNQGKCGSCGWLPQHHIFHSCHSSSLGRPGKRQGNAKPGYSCLKSLIP